MYNNPYNAHQLPLITPQMYRDNPDQVCDILNRLIRSTPTITNIKSGGGGEGNLEDIIQTTTSYADGGVNIVTAYLSDGTTQEFQIRNGHQGSQGEPGTDGHDGADGQSATVSVGTTTTLPAGSSATVSNVGTSLDAVFDFGIPRGADGQNGQDGQDGFSPIATVSKAGDTATITITDENGTTTASVTDGTDGAPGQAATVAAGTTTTLPAGSSATVTNSGTSSAAVFDFGIPKGDTGAAGQDGADGADGFSPIATVSKVGDTATITITDENGTTTASVTDGSDGAPGAAATIAVGTTTTLSPGSSATVTNSGTSSAAVFDFGIPQGATGAAGPANTLSIGTVTGGVTADATITGTSPNQTLNLVLPKGDTGDTGPKGEPGKGVPIGSIIPYVSGTMPDGYLLCDGSAVSRTTYADLFAVIGTTYGSGDGSTTFNLPDLKGKVAVGQDANDTSFDELGETGGEKTHTLTVQEMPSHRHSYNDYWAAAYTSENRHAVAYEAVGSGNSGGTNYTGGGQAHNNLQPYVVTVYIIKYADTAATVADVLNAYSSSTTDVYSAEYVNSIIPTVPTVNDATLTIQKNGTSVGTFTANSASNVTANITVPTAVSELNNDSGYLTSVAWNDVTGKPTFATVATSGSYTDLSNTPTIPTKTSDLNNDSGFISSIPIASANSLGGIKVGNNLTIAADGTLSATGGGGGLTIDDVYPVGSIYMSVNNNSPANFIGGTWVQIEDTFLLAAGTNHTAGSTGGAETVTLTTSEMPRHSHKLMSSSNGTLGDAPNSSAARWSTSSDMRYSVWGNNGTPTYYPSEAVGGGQAHNNMPPYLTVYMWRRVS